MKTHSTFPYLFRAVLLTLQSHAQLALVRQGRESAGTMEPADELPIDTREDGLVRYRIPVALRDERAFYQLSSDTPPR
ncbi:MAG: hypothetical protein ACI8XO_001266 [Verrucomicrobiales bacterium]|jgi:hypothetical protein